MQMQLYPYKGTKDPLNSTIYYSQSVGNSIVLSLDSAECITDDGMEIIASSFANVIRFSTAVKR